MIQKLVLLFDNRWELGSCCIQGKRAILRFDTGAGTARNRRGILNDRAVARCASQARLIARACAPRCPDRAARSGGQTAWLLAPGLARAANRSDPEPPMPGAALLS